MQPRTSLLLGLGALGGLIVLSALLGRSQGVPTYDWRPSSLSSAPLGARGLAESLERLGVGVTRYRKGLWQLVPDTVGGSSAFVLLDPSVPLSSTDAVALQGWSGTPQGGDLVLAGPGASGVMNCFGYAVDAGSRDSVLVRPVPDDAEPWPRVGAVLAARSEAVVVDSSRVADASRTSCVVPPIARVDTLVVAVTGRVVALRLTRADVDHQVLLVSDANLFRNRTMRETAAGPFVLGLFAGRYHRVIFEETHHGFGAGGSLTDATFRWSLQSPWGWAAWQVALVGLVALLAGAFRFGPIRAAIPRQRRSPLEHVKALATALAAARGHDVAIGSIINGLRRRLLPTGQRLTADWRPWLDQLGRNAETPRARDAVQTLTNLTRPGQPPTGVLRAANAVEDVWEELRP